MKKKVMKLITMMLITIVLFTGCKIQSVEDFNKDQLVDSQDDAQKEKSDKLEVEDIDKEDKENKDNTETDKTEVDSEEKLEDKKNNKFEDNALKDKDKNRSKEEKVHVNKDDTAKTDKNNTGENTKKPESSTQTKPNTKPSGKPKPVENTKPAEKPKPEEKPQPAKQYVTIEIRVDTILKNYDKLDPKLQSEKFVPSSGVILKKTSIELLEGETVFDILVKATRQNRIHMDYQGGSGNQYGSAYIKGINNIYEFSCGDLSGWVYKVNGVQPSHGVSAHKLKGGEAISFNYTCDQGRDI